MTPRENLMVTRLVNRLVGQADLPKDADAEFELATLLKTRPDAAYLLLQRCLMLEVSLAQTGDELNALRTSGVVGAPNASSTLAPSSMPPAQPQPLIPQTPAQPQPQPQPQPTSFLRNAATIGAGVLGGSLLFQGVESLLHGSGHGLLGGTSLLGAGAGGVGTANNFASSPTAPLQAIDAGALDAASNGLNADADAADSDTDTDTSNDDDSSWA